MIQNIFFFIFELKQRLTLLTTPKLTHLRSNDVSEGDEPDFELNKVAEGDSPPPSYVVATEQNNKATGTDDLNVS